MELNILNNFYIKVISNNQGYAIILVKYYYAILLLLLLCINVLLDYNAELN